MVQQTTFQKRQVARKYLQYVPFIGVIIQKKY